MTQINQLTLKLAATLLVTSPFAYADDLASVTAQYEAARDQFLESYQQERKSYKDLQFTIINRRANLNAANSGFCTELRQGRLEYAERLLLVIEDQRERNVELRQQRDDAYSAYDSLKSSLLSLASAQSELLARRLELKDKIAINKFMRDVQADLKIEAEILRRHISNMMELSRDYPSWAGRTCTFYHHLGAGPEAYEDVTERREAYKALRDTFHNRLEEARRQLAELP